ncbi:MAG: hypothetical protein IPG96_01075 [Proteobacteria bacterium]|nr:hypothetical protein [Pseudomonadota bacterium]
MQVGARARVLALSGRAGQTLVLDRFRAGKRLERRLLVGGTSPTLIELPVTEQDRGGFALTLWTVIDQQYVELARSVLVPWDNKELAVSFATFRDRLRPGSQERFTVQVKGPRGKDAAVGAAELLAYMYDRSLDAFAPHRPPAIAALYPSRAWPGTTRATLGAATSSWVPHEGFAPLPDAPLLQGDALKLLSGYGVGGPGVRRGGRGMMRLRMMDGAGAPQAG